MKKMNFASKSPRTYHIYQTIKNNILYKKYQNNILPTENK